MRVIPNGFEADARSGMTNRELMKKYRIGPDTLDEWRFELDIPPNKRGGGWKRKIVSKFDDDGRCVATYESVREAAQATYCHWTGISNAVKTGRKAYGFFWKFGGVDDG